MKAGGFDRRVQFRRAALVDDGFSVTEVFADHGAEVWASKADISDGERWRAGEVGATISTRFTIRFSAFTADITPADELVCEGRTYNITGIKEIGRRQGFEVTASARTDK